MFVYFPIRASGGVLNGVDKLFIEGSCFLLRCYGWFVIESDDDV